MFIQTTFQGTFKKLNQKQTLAAFAPSGSGFTTCVCVCVYTVRLTSFAKRTNTLCLFFALLSQLFANEML